MSLNNILERKSKTTQLLELTERLAEIADAMVSMETRILSTLDNLEGFYGSFPEGEEKLHHQLVIRHMAYARLKEMYRKQLDLINSEL